MEKYQIGLVELFEWFIKSNSPPNELSTEYDGDDNTMILLKWHNGTMLYLPHTAQGYNDLWKRFQKYWNKNL